MIEWEQACSWLILPSQGKSKAREPTVGDYRTDLLALRKFGGHYT